MRSRPEQETEAVVPSRRRIGWLEAALLLAALLTIVVGGLSVRLGPRWPRRVFFRAPAGIVIHHTATGAYVKGRRVDADLISEWHEHRGWGAEYRGEDYHIGYHYVILPDGTVQAGRPEWMRGAHARGHNDFLGICLVGNFDPDSNPDGSQQPDRPTDEQLDALVGLLRDLLTKYRLTTGDIYRHSDLGATVCPGERFPMEEVIRRVKQK
jgi:hypothetical protein